jgi:hypothetical protein
MRTKNIIVICVTLLIAGILFWPTLYRYDKMTIAGNSLPIRMNRFTGHTEYFGHGKWVPEKEQVKKLESSRIPFEEKSKITGNASLGYGSFSGKIYNGSSWTISSLNFRVKAKEKNGSIRWDRTFNESIQIASLSTSSFYVAVTGDEGIDSINWSIDEVLGFKISE